MWDINQVQKLGFYSSQASKSLYILEVGPNFSVRGKTHVVNFQFETPDKFT